VVPLPPCGDGRSPFTRTSHGNSRQRPERGLVASSESVIVIVIVIVIRKRESDHRVA
jgi:hypothetical protein